jgi:hypothetical protein
MAVRASPGRLRGCRPRPRRILVTCASARWPGTPGEVVARLRAFAGAGAGAGRAYLQVLDLDDREHLELLAAEVAPQLP